MLKEDTIDSNSESITLYKGDFYGFEKATGSQFEIKRFFESSQKIPRNKFDGKLVEVGNLLVINDKFFVSGTCREGYHYILQALKTWSKWELFSIYALKSDETFSDKLLGLSKSLCGNILVNLFDKILHLSTSGDIEKTINLSFDIRDVLQLNKESYVVYRRDEVCIINDKGNILFRNSVISFPSFSKRFRLRDFRSMSVLAKDNHGNIYVYKSASNSMFIFDHCLTNISSFNLKKSLRNFFYNEENNVLIILCEDNSVLTYSI